MPGHDCGWPVAARHGDRATRAPPAGPPAPDETAQPPALPLQADAAALLPAPLADRLRRLGWGGNLYPWQRECLALPGVLEGRNLVFSAPTGAGKSLVGEALLLRRVATTGRPALVVLPFTALCDEWSERLRAPLAALGRDVLRAYGPTPAALVERTGAVVCTLERASLLLGRLLAVGELDVFSLVLVDELHMVGEVGRGVVLESLLARLMYIADLGAQEDERGQPTDPGEVSISIDGPNGDGSVTQIVGMSATMADPALAARWLKAALHTTEFRPVELRQYVKAADGEVLDADASPVPTLRVADPSPSFGDRGRDHACALAAGASRDGGGCLIFCATKREAEETALRFARLVREGKVQPGKVDAAAEAARAGLATQLRTLASCQDGRRPRFLAGVARRPPTRGPEGTELAGLIEVAGVAYHHGGLGRDVRAILEDGFRAGTIRVLANTRTLAVGVNLPVRRVIVQHAWTASIAGQEPMDASTYRQIAGRAGRPGRDVFGECFVCVSAGRSALGAALALLRGNPADASSRLEPTACGLARMVLEAVAGGIVRTRGDARALSGFTLLAAERTDIDEGRGLADVAEAALDLLVESGLAKRAGMGGLEIEATPFGALAVSTGLSVERAVEVRADLARAQLRLMATGDLHIAYLCVAQDRPTPLRWSVVLRELLQLQDHHLAVAEAVGIDLSALRALAVATTHGRRASEPDETVARGARRLCAALLLLHLVGEEEPGAACQRFEVSSADARDLRERSGRFAAAVAGACHQLGWEWLEMQAARVQEAAQAGVDEELRALTSLPWVAGSTAARLCAAGFRSPEDLARDEPGVVEGVERAIALAISVGPRPGRSRAEKIVAAARAYCARVGGGAGRQRDAPPVLREVPRSQSAATPGPQTPATPA